MTKKSKKNIMISCGLIISGCIMMAVQVAAPVTVAGFILIFIGSLLFANLESDKRVETEGDDKVK